jgi:hypothetical protein
MSCATGYILKPDHSVAFFKWDGTIDIPQSKIFSTLDALWASPRLNSAECTCDQLPVSCDAHADYGNGLNFTVEACFNCNAIVSWSPPNYHFCGKPEWINKK